MSRLVTPFWSRVVYCDKNKHNEGDFVECGTWKGGCYGYDGVKPTLKYGSSPGVILHFV
jgi:hypothetical protein